MKHLFVIELLIVCWTTVATVHHKPMSFESAFINSTKVTLPVVNLFTLLPPAWNSMCRIKHASPLDEVDVIVTCQVTVNDKVHWHLDDLRQTLGPVALDKKIEVAIEIECKSGSNISLPYPMRASGLVKLKVFNCRLLDKFADFRTPAQNLTDSLRILELRNCTWLMRPVDVKIMTMTRETMNNYMCSQEESLVEMIYTNVRDEHIKDRSAEHSLNTSERSVQHAKAESSEDLLRMFEIIPSCNFSNLEVLEESHSPTPDRQAWELMVKSKFPVLRVMNFSFMDLAEIPGPLLEWRRYFKHLATLDLSHNSIKKLDIPFPFHPKVTTTFDLRYNQITQITMGDVKNWAGVRNFYVDIRHNPLDCNCAMKDFLLLMRTDSEWEDKGMAYYKSYIPDMTCATPPHVAGRTLWSLRGDELSCPETPLDLKPLTIALVVMAAVLLVLLMLAILFRREVRILLFTRGHVMLPCGRPLTTSDLCPEKKYDAFVSYAHQDCEWVTDTLCPRLERMTSPTHGRPIKLCIHQRDFVNGKPLIDNIIDCIAASRHTIIVLTPSFVQSPWALDVLEEALRRSVGGRQYHLLLVMLEDVPYSDMPPALRDYCKTFTCLDVKDKLFWDRLTYSLHDCDDTPLDIKVKMPSDENFDNVVIENGAWK